MLNRVVRFFITLTCVIVGGALLKLASPLLATFITLEFFQVDTGIFQLTLANLLCIVIGAVLGGVGGWFVSPFFIRKLGNFTAFVEKNLSKMPINDVIAGAIGLAIGLIIADLLGNAFSRIPGVGNYIPIIFSIVLGYLGIHLTIKKRKELAGSFEFVPRVLKEVLRSRDAEKNAKQAKEIAETSQVTENISEAVPTSAEEVVQQNTHKVSLLKVKEDKSKNYKILDTNVIIDGRIADICKTVFL